MCLFSYQKRVKLAKEDITCYKVLVSNIYGIFTPVQWASINNDVLSGKKTFNASGIIKRERGLKGQRIYSGGLIHSYLYEPTAYIGDNEYAYGLNYIICKCHVPKGTRYVKGGYDRSNPSEIAAKKIVFDEIIFDGRK